jgi:predicted MFS family arabinose efflux permease
MIHRMNLVAAAFSLTALSYGLARFAYGLVLPEIREELSLGATAAGWIGGGAFLAYCFGIVLAFAFERRLGERRISVLAGLTSTVGLGLVSTTQSATGLGLAMALAGLSTGLTSPPLAVAVTRCVEASARPRANGMINAGTAMGIVLSGVLVLMFPGHWRELYALFAVVGALVTLWLWFAMPEATDGRFTLDLEMSEFVRKGVAGLCASSFCAGVGSTAIWTFGASLLREDLGLTEASVSLAWIILGAAGTFGAATGVLTDRLGIRSTHRLSLSLMAFAIAGLAAASLYPPIGFAVMGLFGMAYIVATGTLLIWGIQVYADRPAIGLGLPFLILALGQAAGAPLFGAILDLAGSAPALLSFATVMAVATIWSVKPLTSLASPVVSHRRDGGQELPVGQSRKRTSKT